MLIRGSENEVVDRGFQAVVMIYQLTNRVPALIERSHLERKEGAISIIQVIAHEANAY